MPDDLHTPLDDRGEQDAGRRRAVTKATDHNSTIDLAGLDDAAPIITTAQNFKLWDVEDQVAPQDLMTGVDKIPHNTRKRKASPDYERKPRPRTREDRYEYKGKNAERKSGSGDRTKKRIQRSRKHTLNDGFHAPNVPRERLTLRGHMKGGIFNKAKASGPLGLQDNVSVPAPDARLPLRKNDNEEESPLATTKSKRAARGDKNRQTRLEYNFPDCAETPEGKSTANPGQHPNSSTWEGRGAAYNRKRPREPERDDISRDSHLQRRLDGENLKEGRLENGAHIAIGKSKSPTPYTWSETDKGKPMSEHDNIEATLLELLHAGVSSLDSEPHGTRSKDGCERIYLNLEDLKGLMKSREAIWPSETHGAYRNPEHPTLIQKSSVKRTIPVADRDVMCKDDSPGDGNQDATHRSKKARLRDPAASGKAKEVRDSTRPPIDPEDPKPALHSRQQQPEKQHIMDASKAKNSGHKCHASPLAYEEIPVTAKTNVQPAPSSIDKEQNWQLEVIDTDRIFQGRSLSNWLGNDDELPLLSVDEMVDFNESDYYGETSDKPTLPHSHAKPKSGFLANPVDYPDPSVHKDQDEVVPPGFWRRNRLY